MEGVMREPSAGRPALFAGRMTIQLALVVFLFGRTKLPMNVAPLASSMTSPGCALFKALWKLPPAATLMIRPPAAGAGNIAVLRNTCGSAATVSTAWPMIVIVVVALTFPTAAVKVTTALVPPPTAVISPVGEMVAFVGLLEVHVGVIVVVGLPLLSMITVPSCEVWLNN